MSGSNSTLQDFQQMKLSELQNYLSVRSINITGNKDILARNAYYAHLLNIPPSYKSQQDELKNDRKKKIDGYVICEPKSIESGWVNRLSFRM